MRFFLIASAIACALLSAPASAHEYATHHTMIHQHHRRPQARRHRGMRGRLSLRSRRAGARPRHFARMGWITRAERFKNA